MFRERKNLSKVIISNLLSLGSEMAGNQDSEVYDKAVFFGVPLRQIGRIPAA